MTALLATAGCGSPSGSGEIRNVPLPDDDLRRLELTMRDAGKYDGRRLLEIDSLSRELAGAGKAGVPAVRLCLKVGERWLTFNADSSLRYARKALDMSREVDDRALTTDCRIAVADALSAAGIFTQAMDEFRSLSGDTLPRPQRTKLWRTGRQMYSYMCNYLGQESPYHDAYRSRYMAYDDSLLSVLPPTDSYCRFLQAERLVTDGRYLEAKKMLQHILDTTADDDRLHGMASYQMAEVFRNQGDEANYARYLARAAECDIKSGVKEGLALPNLAVWLYEHGKSDKAFTYINYALGEASSGGARMRLSSIASMMPLIDEGYRKQISHSHRQLTVYLILTTVLMLVSVVLIVVLRRQSRRSKEANRKLAASAGMKDQYIANFLELCASYADKLDSMSKMVMRKLTAGQGDELLKLVKSGKLHEATPDEDFYEIIDRAVLNMFPEFIFEVNKLLRPDCRIEIAKPSTLTPELRIYAFVRLGVVESKRIAQILHYSLNTVYTYRNKMRNRAVSRDDFDANVMKIGRHTDL